ncbi:MAG: beta-mannosidase [Ruminococcaceae bacterium]|nr:beta-mannosidase [Oscillospiraceae bacterium]
MKRLTALLLIAAFLLAGCTGQTTETGPKEETQWAAETVGVYEAEAGSLHGQVKVENSGYVTGFEQDTDLCTITADIPEAGFYDLEFLIKAIGGYKENYVLVDGQRVGTISADGEKFQRSTIRRVFLDPGSHEITVAKYWGYIHWDKVTVLTSRPFDESVFQVSPRLVNENATDNAKRLFSYLCDSYGKYILSGQYCDTGANGWENLKIAENNGGKYPAILGLDVGYYSQTGVDHGVEIKTTEQAIAYWEKGGIVTLCWHWLAPERYITGTWYSAFRPEEVSMDLTAIMNGEDAEGLELLKKDIDNIAKQLLAMQEAGVPVLWRPLHEASGGWFWWGAEGAETYKKLYILLYDTLTNEYGLNNLIWVWNGQDGDWYPGDEYVDIVGMDIYAGERVYTSQIDRFMTNLGYSQSKKMVVLSENGTMIDPELSVRDRAMWGYFCTWSGEFVMNDGIRKTYSEQYTDVEMLTKVYNSEYVITRDELPDLHSYPIREEAQ